ncbi:2-polyprenyl-6-methoxyphenol hydroxylase [Actinopolyspora alba]|uniref:2-polyprenyl-6-methoxyphenol hydroxylase n=1 Tax=Actinopolyspora alba TaxID=673379 RepID=A0A1I2C2V1_9ACTN|nr:NAD(P)/FAD-dependent oxidoreductase [Actinopolyspora alba]SFE62073.1 2-polyprenyl-6-methoxyphenol hydroxylase [Actinopolyspora alba]
MSGPRADRNVAVVGGGVAGPTLAVGLARSGYHVTIYEAHTRRVQDVGSFFNLAPLGRTVLEELGIDHVLESGTVCTGISFRNHKGRWLANNPETTTNIMRGELSAALREAAIDEGVELKREKRLSSLTEQPDGSWELSFADGSTAEADVVVGSDGVHSDVRRHALPRAPVPSYAGVIGSGGLSEVSERFEVDGTFHMTFGLRGFFGYQVISPGRILWFENHYESEERTFKELADLTDDEWMESLVERHRTDARELREIIRSAAGTVWRWPVYEVPQLEQWHRGTAMVIGDAAHAIQPHLGIGATLALEDAYELTAALRRQPEVTTAFAEFQADRRARVAEMCKQAQRMGSIMTPRHWWERMMRDLTLPMAIKKGIKRSEQGFGYRLHPWPPTSQAA